MFDRIASHTFVFPILLLLSVAVSGCTRFDGSGRSANQSLSTTHSWAADLDIDALEREIHRRANHERERRRLPATSWQPQLRDIAYGHSRNMARRDTFAHEVGGQDFEDRYQLAGFSCRVPAGRQRFLSGGENLFRVHRVAQWVVYSDGRQEPQTVRTLAQLAEAAVQGWMDSPPHRQNLLNPSWRTAAIGVYVDADGWMWVTQNFC
ncbi:MAG: hypothetical protein ACJA1R_001596 [Flavobacteriales bacterium]|jgi:uncharacterized protein YkwD